MRMQAIFVIVTQLLTLIFAIYSVQNRNDRRVIPKHLIEALKAASLFAVIILGAAVVLGQAAAGHRFLAIREVFEIGFAASCVAISVALRIHMGSHIRKGDAKDRVKTKPTVSRLTKKTMSAGSVK